RAMSLDPVELCESDEVLLRLAGCKTREQSELIRRTDAAIKKALAAAHPATAVLLKRDQAWFRELIANASGPDIAAALMRERIATLDGMVIGRSGLTGRWENAFAATQIAGEGEGSRVIVRSRFHYGDDDSPTPLACNLTALLRQDGSSWFGGVADAVSPREDAKPLIKIRRQGETLRVVVQDEQRGDK